MAKRRLDTLLVERGLAASPEQARAAVMAGQVRIGSAAALASKAGFLVEETAELSLAAAAEYASRGGEKLAHALDVYGLDVAGAVAADIGASTGGFTDCLLRRGAGRVYAVDVGRGQLDYRLRRDERVVVMDGTNARLLKSLPEPVDLATIDVSFISLQLVLPAVSRLLKPEGRILVLFKPQFEARRDEVLRKGVIRDPLLHATLIGRFVAWAKDNAYRVHGPVRSPLVGPAGNIEFFFLLKPPPQ